MIDMINANKPERWKSDIADSIDQYNQWFIEFAPEAFRAARGAVVDEVRRAMLHTHDFADLGPTQIEANPGVVRTLRMSTAPPLARDRLIGLACTKRSLVAALEKGSLPKRMKSAELTEHLERISATLSELLDIDILPWITESRLPQEPERIRAASVVADRLCGAIANPIIRNAQETRQIAVIRSFLVDCGYREQMTSPGMPVQEMAPGTFAVRMNVGVKSGSAGMINMPIDLVVQPGRPEADRLPIFVEAKSAGDFANTNKRRKEEATKVNQLKNTYGENIRFVLFLCGYFNCGYLGYEAAEGIDWVWEHRVEDLMDLGL